MAVTIEQVEDALSRTVLVRPPREIVVIDGVIDVERRGRKKGTAIAMIKKDVAVFTPMSRLDSIFHEALHQGILGFGILGGEVIADLGGKVLAIKYSLFPGFRKRVVRYQECGCKSHEQILAELGLEPMFEGKPVIRHYRLVEE
ncbi:MAG: hypothetical protein QXP81_09305 [Nitrososphaerota archaeon]